MSRPYATDDFDAIRQRMQEIADEKRDPVMELLSLPPDPDNWHLPGGPGR